MFGATPAAFERIAAQLPRRGAAEVAKRHAELKQARASMGLSMSSGSIGGASLGAEAQATMEAAYPATAPKHVPPKGQHESIDTALAH